MIVRNRYRYRYRYRIVATGIPPVLQALTGIEHFSTESDILAVTFSSGSSDASENQRLQAGGTPAATKANP